MPALNRLRELGVIERYHAVRHSVGMDACVATSARYSTQDNTVLTSDLLFPALRTLIEAHAMLGVRFDSREDTLDVAYFRLETVDLSRVVHFSRDRDLQAALEKQLSRGFEDTQGDMPLWRLEVLIDNTIILALHHAIGDGLSSAVFHRSLLRALQETNPPTSSPSVHVPELSLPPPIEHVTDIRPSLFTTLGVIYPNLLPASWTSAYSAWTGNPIPTVAALQTHVRLLRFEAADVKKFSEICRSHKTSITSAIYELSVCVISRLLSNEPEKYKTITINLPISLRQLAGAQYDDVMGNYVSSSLTYPLLHPEFSWKLAARVAAELQVQKQKSREMLGLLSWVAPRFAAWMNGQLGQKRPYTLNISNLGRFQDPVLDGKWALCEMFFCQCDSVAGPAMCMNVAGDSTGGLGISFTWGAGVDSAFLDAFVSMFRESFQNILT
ncbi:alcohol acetyltransferase [Mycena rosella]|uniref:Alcohol acetyltransferase n=1 Tax=Mycena rosella TaxID=1033263 RepID=A0AAD7DRY6_MYCRO|nr:alcohol acetyltransferase [Mycena rosella]